MYAKTDKGPTHACLLLKLTRNWTHWNTFYTWCMQYQNDMRFLIVAQHSVKVNVDVLTDNISVISSKTHLHFNTCPSSVQNYLNSKWLVTVNKNIEYTIMYIEHVARVPSLRCRSSCGYIKRIKVCMIGHLYFVLWNSNTHTCNHATIIK